MADDATLAAVVAGIQGVMFGNVDNVTDERRTQAATVALQRCEQYAPDAPAETLIEAATQMAGYLLGTSPGSVAKSGYLVTCLRDLERGVEA